MYQKLFLEGEDSDITINVFNKQYHLHRMFLSQSQYLANILGQDFDKKILDVEISDESITLEGT